MNRSNSTMRQTIGDLILIAAGCVFYAAGMALTGNFMVIPGNFLGLAVVANKLWGWPTGVVNICLSVPTIILGTIVIGRRMLVYTILAIAGFSGMIDFFGFLSFPALHSEIAAVLLGGALIGFGCGMIYYAGATTGGTTIFGRMIIGKFPRCHLGNLLIAMDGIIIVAGALTVHDFIGFLYSIVFEVVICKMIDYTMQLFIRLFGIRW
ncbi:MAG: YitT family protein [Bilifractor sp.]|jgi:uncharacterized membrane-anchored protein YitT (DUF2179 family)